MRRADVVLVTPRLRLRRARPEDLDVFHAILSDPETMRWWSSEPHASLEQTREWLDAMIAAPEEESDDFVVELGGRAIGKAGCHRLPEVGYVLHRDFLGRGYATEAMAAVVRRLFASRPVARLTADVDPANAASIRLLKRLGFEETGRASNTWFIGGRWHDSVYFALDRARAGAPA